LTVNDWTSNIFFSLNPRVISQSRSFNSVLISPAMGPSSATNFMIRSLTTCSAMERLLRLRAQPPVGELFFGSASSFESHSAVAVPLLNEPSKFCWRY